ncbi:MAG: WG repeat-containing protein, partial [Alphaproteobacteria bacterium]|nr:WG repeat-containing protein [Alphaproteobacteria bacterium]
TGWGYIDTTGNFVVEPKFSFAYPFDRYGYAIVENNRRMGLINSTGKIIVPPIYDDVFVNQGVIFATLNKKWGILDSNGQLIRFITVDWVAKEW